MENLKYIFTLDNYINNLSEEIKSNKQLLYNHLIETNISNYIDKEKVTGPILTKLLIQHNLISYLVSSEKAII